MSSTNRGANRREKDNYPTPSWCSEVLLPEIVWGHIPRILEPAVGDGAILNVITNAVPCQYHGIDIRETFEWGHGQDFLKYGDDSISPPDQRWDFIVTNPPFSFAKEFVEKARQIANCVIMLLPMGFYGAEERHVWWEANRPTANFVLSRRPMFGKNKDGKWGTDSETYNWVIWDTTGRQKTGTHFLNPTDEQYKRSVADFKQKYGGEPA